MSQVELDTQQNVLNELKYDTNDIKDENDRDETISENDDIYNQ